MNAAARSNRLRPRPWTLSVALVLAALAVPKAGDAADDGAYGRLDGDLDLRAGTGASFVESGASLCAHAAAVYLGTAGVYAHYVDTLGADSSAETRSLATGVLLQPLFLGRYASGLERGPATLDLFLDSVALGVGAFWGALPGEGLAPEPGIELSLSVDLPLLASATGPFLGLRGALRWQAPELTGRTGERDGQRALLAITLSWHHVVAMHLVDPGDRASAARQPRPRVAAERTQP